MSLRITWVQPEDLLRHEFRQQADEGNPALELQRRWTAAGGDLQPPYRGASEPPADPPLRSLAEQLLAQLNERVTAGDADEPADLEAIFAAAAPVPELLPDRAGYADRVHGAWLGRAAGCLLGKPVERIPRDGIKEILQSSGHWPLAGYFTAVGVPAEVSERWPWNRASRPTSLAENIDGMPEDDDLNYTLMALRMLERHGDGLTADDVAQAWLMDLPAGRVFTAERTAYRNLLQGMSPPRTALHSNPFREWIGAAIRTDCYGWARPGDPRAAARLAWQDARVSHTRNGMYGAMYVAGLAAAAVCSSNLDTVLDAGLSVVPATSRLARSVRQAREIAAGSVDDESGIDEIHELHSDEHWVHVLNNAASLTFGLARSGGDFERAICTVVSAGWDTDSAGATAGAVTGAMTGAAGLPARWIEPLRNRVTSSIPGYGSVAFDELARRTERVAQWLN